MRVVLGIVAGLWSTGALADWQYTRWGMTVDQVIAASNGQAQRFSNPIKNSELTEAMARAAYSGSGINFSAYFNFDRSTGFLSSVSLEPPDPNQCSSVIGKLTNTYGKAELPSNPSDIMDIYKWYDSARGNVIHVIRIGYQRTVQCTLMYQRYGQPGEKGGL